jgi:hypothetical protein
LTTWIQRFSLLSFRLFNQNTKPRHTHHHLAPPTAEPADKTTFTFSCIALSVYQS